MAQLTELQKLVDHHVDEEESTGFSCASDKFDKDELEAMGTEFQRRKDELMVMRFDASPGRFAGNGRTSWLHQRVRLVPQTPVRAPSGCNHWVGVPKPDQ